MQHHTVLGISPGTRSMGIAAMKDGQLIDWKTRTFKGKWNDKKLNEIVVYIKKEMYRHNVRKVAVKLPHPVRSSLWLNDLLNEIKELVRKKNITMNIYFIDDLKYLSGELDNKQKLAEYITSKHPELLGEYEREQQNKNTYYMKMFEAIAAARLIEKEK